MLNTRGSQLDSLQNTRVQDVDTSIDPVPYELYRLLDEAIDARGVVGLVYYDTVFRGFFNFCDHDGTFVAVGFVEVGELGEGVVADNVGVEHEEWSVVFA